MKCLVVLAVIVALCAGGAIPVIPGDNSHYVEGESRYIWMPDGDGVPHLVDLQEPADEELLNDPTRNGANNAYWLFTRSNRNNAQIITNGNANSVWSSNYRGARPLKVIVHGWNNNGNSAVNTMVTSGNEKVLTKCIKYEAFLDVADVNVIVVDWRALANSGYWTAVSGVPSVGNFLGDFLTWLVNLTGTNWNNVHLVGFSLGAHVVGNAGRRTGRRPIRITGLDPAGPEWGGNANALRNNDGGYVECIHTCGGSLGINDPICAANFYPNGGRHRQPGCGLVDYACSHGRSFEFFAATIRFNRLVGRQCSNLSQANNNNCSGNSFNMGNSILSKRGWVSRPKPSRCTLFQFEPVKLINHVKKVPRKLPTLGTLLTAVQ
ncbi:Pancreatic triacylglycerol lipase [Eumeta japonica]|uniref:Pancreatic triacylglycerol lipase n=1 Tax=Eumeta variegata TaxID=151549 RepID=A0A4C1TID5_EUMVA|nr:Pancreatic triacylglycerol lipase [Eumeta japonica]